MIIKEIGAEEFDIFAKKHKLRNFYQTKEYGDLMKHSDFSIMYIGAYSNDTIVAASLIMYKNIVTNIKYGYAPRGFLIDYHNTPLLTKFTKKIKEFFFKKGFAFIKINPEITYSKIDFENKSKTISTKNKELINTLKELGYDKLRDNLYFESLLPKYTPIIYLPNYDFNLLDNSLKESIKEYELSGLKLTRGNKNDIETFYKFIDHKDNKTLTYYKFMYDSFEKSDMVDLILCEVDFQIYVKYLQKQYVNEQERNEKINMEFNKNPNNMDIYNQKTKSDQTLAKISSEIAISNDNMENTSKEILGAAFIIRNQGRVTIITTGQNKKFNTIDTKTFMYYKLIEVYKKAGYNYIDLNGITADFNETNPYKELNDFKLKFKPDVFEYIGELDLIVNKPLHQILWSTNKIQKEFYKPATKK
ncbi:MAG: lipid II:glycine glycyltransferase FemX [Bacilli bacterium]